MISLCSETLKLAENKNNFSEWVRSQLLKSDETKKPSIIWSYYCLGCDEEYYHNQEDNYFYCPRQMQEFCDNKETLTPRRLIQ